jgi:DNA invertase Pin-like site-specific DNA recombinase
MIYSWWLLNAVHNELKSTSSVPMLIGYARVSTVRQSLDHQIGALRASGCDTIFTDKAPGKEVRGRPELDNAIKALGRGDILILAEWNLATRSMFDGITIMQRVHSRGAVLKVLDKSHLDLTTKPAQRFLEFLSALAEDERERIVGRATEGRKAARREGVKLGRKPKLTESQNIKALEELAKGKSCRAIGKELNVHHSTISRLR